MLIPDFAPVRLEVQVYSFGTLRGDNPPAAHHVRSASTDHDHSEKVFRNLIDKADQTHSIKESEMWGLLDDSDDVLNSHAPSYHGRKK